MSPDQLPLHIDPYRYAENRRQLAGELSLAALPRLLDATADPERSLDGRVAVMIECSIDNEGYHTLQGVARCQVALTCQRCLEPVNYPLEAEFSLALVRNSEAAAALPSHYEPLLVEGKVITLAEMVEDELLLALPMIARHQSACLALPQEAADAGKKEHPFAQLQRLKEL
ncbi:MAG: DUF177 domain-containing protein [Gammaproteobacteria bacterium]|nr:DUF177 domain-containing protein [Gammaproteobacteria bacterium]